MSLIRRLRENYHIHRRDRKLARALEQADVLVCFHAKSGSTWLRAMVSHVYHQLYQTPADLLLQGGNLKRHVPDIPAVHFGDGLEVVSRLSGKRLARARDEQRVIFLLRDPRDVSVSFYHHLRERATPRELLRKQVPDEVRELLLYDFMVHSEFGLGRVIQRYNHWMREAPRFEQALVVTYEDLWQDSLRALERTMTLLGEMPSRAVMEAAVEFASFSSLREKERSGFFQGERLKPTATGAGESYKVREGGVGGHRRLFTQEQLAVIDEMVARDLDPSLPYSPTDLQRYDHG
ncbi:sulfotransferase domain-containing protein [Fodinicurvata sediminis]|uniref:sulfotransferase domain-containing protein n=1 Tax=Fodinicurvata sediminis TaxID=1121832 RepID=UPI0003B3408A|nr:sulfotransferase domain-containing protein [Fodinicurvata sediminis]